MQKAFTVWSLVLATWLTKLFSMTKRIGSIAMTAALRAVEKSGAVIGTSLQALNLQSPLQKYQQKHPQNNNPSNVVYHNTNIVTNTNLLSGATVKNTEHKTPAVSKAALEKLPYIEHIFDLLLLADPPDLRANPLWYNDKFDTLYDADLGELMIHLAVLRKTRGKRYI